MDLWRPEDSDGNALSDKEAEEKFIIWYNDVCEERMAMLEAEEAYKKRVKELEKGLSDLLTGFEDAEKEVKYLREKYEQNEDGEVYKEPYDKVYKERETLKEDETRSKKIIKTLQDENVSLKDYAKRAMNGRCTRSSLGYKESDTQHTYSTDIERDNFSENEFSENSGSAQYTHIADSPSNGTEDDKLPLVLHNRCDVLHSPQSDVTLENATYVRTTNTNITYNNNNDDTTQVYTRRNILTYRNEVQALLSERLKVEERLAAKRQSRTRNQNESRNYRGKLTNQVNSVMKYKNVMRHLEKGLIVITASERMEALEQENKKLKVQLDKLERERNVLVENLDNFQIQDNGNSKFNSRRSSQRTQKSTRKPSSQVKLPKIIKRETGNIRNSVSRESSPASLPSIDSSRSMHENGNVTFYKTPVKKSVYHEGYTSLLRKQKYNKNIL